VKKIISTGLAVAAALSLVGCGGGSSSAPQSGIGYYEDAAIEGVHYQCGNKSGETGADGRFEYQIGKGCTFSIGKTTLGGRPAAVFGGGKVHIQETNKGVLILLAGFDLDADPRNGFQIDIDAAKAAMGDKELDMDEGIDAATRDGLIEDYENEAGDKYKSRDGIDYEALDTHLQDRLKGFLGGKTFYLVRKGVLKKAVFNSDLTLSELYICGGGEKESSESHFENGNRLVFEDGSYLKVKLAKEKYILIQVKEANGHKHYTRLYTKKSDAEAFLKELEDKENGGGQTSGPITQVQLTAALINKHLYRAKKDCNSQMILQELDIKKETVSYLENGVKEFDSASFTISGPVMDIPVGKIDVKLKAIEITKTYIKFIETEYGEHTKTDTQVWYYNKADAQAHPKVKECHGGGATGGAGAISGCHMDGKKLVVDEGKTCSLGGHTAVCENGKIKIDNTFTAGNVANIYGYQFSCSK